MQSKAFWATQCRCVTLRLEYRLSQLRQQSTEIAITAVVLRPRPEACREQAQQEEYHTMMGLCRWKWTMQATSDLVAFWNRACRIFLQGSVQVRTGHVTWMRAPSP